MVQVISFDFEENNFADIAFRIRQKVFVDEQHVSRTDENDHFEKTARHYLAYYDEKPVGASRWRETSQGIKLERFAVLIEYRNKGIGDLMLKKIIRDVSHLNKPIYLHAQLPAVNFYKKAGFQVTGEIFSEANIEHYKMELGV